VIVGLGTSRLELHVTSRLEARSTVQSMKIKEKEENLGQKVGNELFIPYFDPEILAPGRASGFELGRLVPRPAS